jgi:hypothetical protein
MNANDKNVSLSSAILPDIPNFFTIRDAWCRSVSHFLKLLRCKDLSAMKDLISKIVTDNRSCGIFAVVSALLLVLFATTALADAVDDGLPADSPAAVKSSTKHVIQKGLKTEDTVKLTRAMLQNKFDEQHIQLAHALMIEAKNSGMPVQPLMNKAFEGMAKGVPPPMILSAMETVQSRNAFAFRRAAKLTNDRSRTENLGRTLAAGLAAGLTEEDADTITEMAQQRAGSMNSDQAYSLALESFQTARDVSRLGVSSQTATSMVTRALDEGFNHEDLRTMRSSFMMQVQHAEPESLARGYTSAIQEGRGFQKGPGTTGGQSGSPGPGVGGGSGSGGAGSGASGPGSGGSGSGPGSGGSGSGTGNGGSGSSGGSGSGGSGSGGSGSGSGGSGNGGSGGPGPGGGNP